MLDLSPGKQSGGAAGPLRKEAGPEGGGNVRLPTARGPPADRAACKWLQRHEQASAGRKGAKCKRLKRHAGQPPARRARGPGDAARTRGACLTSSQGLYALI